jgi:S1-C subfamily serine protease
VLGGILLDVILLALVVGFAFMGYRQGFIVGALSFVGFFGGGVLGTLLAPPIATGLVTGAAQQALLALVLVLLVATIGQLVASAGGAALRDRVVWGSGYSVDAVGGAFVSGIALLLVAWLIGSAVARSPFEGLRTQVSNSTVLAAVQGAVPNVIQEQFAPFRRFVDQTEFPQVFGGLAGEQVPPVAAPDPRVVNSRAFRLARRSIVKVEGNAPSCRQRVQGTGFVYSPRRVMTNAHVVAGVRAPSVITLGGTRLRATVVSFDPDRDVAVLSVPRLRLRSLKFSPEARSGDNAIVAGFPKGQPFTTAAARVRGTHEATAQDIYDSGEVTRQIYSIRGPVKPGNSGGPLLAPDGTVDGVIFAAALDSPDTGYVLTAREVAANAERGRTAVQPVSTLGCTDATG